MFKIYKYLSNCLREEHLRNDLLVEYFCCLRRFSSVVELFISFFDKWVEFCKKLLGAIFMVTGGRPFSLFLFVK